MDIFYFWVWILIKKKQFKVKYIITNVQMIKKQSRSEIESQKMLSKGTFKTNSQHNLMGDSFGQELMENRPGSGCTFCIYKSTIINKLKLLKEIIEQKTEKIRELQSIIYTITNVALGKQNDEKMQNQLNNSNRCQKYWQKLEEMQEVSFSQNRFQKLKENKENFYEESSKKASRESSLVSSQIKSEKEVRQQINMRVEIKKEIKNMNLDLDKPLIEDKQIGRKQSDLKKKLIQIINVLPNNNREALKEFQTLSQPHNEGTTGLINSKVSNHKRLKNVGFLKKVQSSQQFSEKGNFVSDSFSQCMKLEKNK